MIISTYVVMAIYALMLLANFLCALQVMGQTLEASAGARVSTIVMNVVIAALAVGLASRVPDGVDGSWPTICQAYLVFGAAYGVIKTLVTIGQKTKVTARYFVWVYVGGVFDIAALGWLALHAA